MRFAGWLACIALATPATAQIVPFVGAGTGLTTVVGNLRVRAVVGSPFPSSGSAVLRLQEAIRQQLDEPEVPELFRLSGNYPNPFGASTTFKLELPEEARVVMTVFDLLGRRVGVLADETLSAGVHEVVWSAGGLPPGPYLFKLQAGSESEAGLMIKAR